MKTMQIEFIVYKNALRDIIQTEFNVYKNVLREIIQTKL